MRVFKRKKVHLIAGTMLLIMGSLLGCGKKSGGGDAESPLTPEENARRMEEAVGLYKFANPTYEEYFLISADKAIYTFYKKQTDYERIYRGALDKLSFTLSDSTFSSGDEWVGQKMIGDEKDLPENLKILFRINQKAHSVINAFNENELKLEIWLISKIPGFSANQVAILQAMIDNIDEIIDFMVSEKLKGLSISDYTNKTLYKKRDMLNLPSGITIEADEFAAKLKDGSLQVVNLDE